MITLQKAIKNIQTSLKLEYKRGKSLSASKTTFDNVVINGSQLQQFSYGKLSLKRQNKRRNKIRPKTLKTLPSEIPKDKESQSCLFRNQTIKGSLNINLEQNKKDESQLFQRRTRPLIKEKIVIEGETIKSLSFYINHLKKNSFQLGRRSNQFQRQHASTRYGSFKLQMKIRSHSSQKQTESERKRYEESCRQSRAFAQFKSEDQKSIQGINNLIICHQNNPLDFKAKIHKKMIKYSKSMEKDEKDLDLTLFSGQEYKQKSNNKIYFSNPKKKSLKIYQPIRKSKVDQNDNLAQLIKREQNSF